MCRGRKHEIAAMHSSIDSGDEFICFATIDASLMTPMLFLKSYPYIVELRYNADIEVCRQKLTRDPAGGCLLSDVLASLCCLHAHTTNMTRQVMIPESKLLSGHLDKRWPH